MAIYGHELSQADLGGWTSSLCLYLVRIAGERTRSEVGERGGGVRKEEQARTQTRVT